MFNAKTELATTTEEKSKKEENEEKSVEKQESQPVVFQCDDQELVSQGMYLVQEESFIPRLRHKERRRRYRVPKESRVYISGIPEDQDVLFGRGGHFK